MDLELPRSLTKVNFQMLTLSRQTITRRDIKVSSQDYENLVTFWKGTESPPPLCPTCAVPCTVHEWAACPAPKSWLYFSSKEERHHRTVTTP